MKAMLTLECRKALCNQAVNQVIRDYEDNNFVFTNIAQIYDNTLPGSALRRVVIATYINKPKESASLYEEEEKSFLECPEFLLDLTKALSVASGGWRSLKLILGKCRKTSDPCHYHHHATGEKCTKATGQASV